MASINQTMTGTRTDNLPTAFAGQTISQRRRQTTISCQYCKMCFSSKWSLENHTLHTHPQESQFICIPCSRTFELERDLNAHLKKSKRHLNDGQLLLGKSFFCTICPRAFKSKQGLSDHTKVKHPTKRKNESSMYDSSPNKRYHQLQETSLDVTRNDIPQKGSLPLLASNQSSVQSEYGSTYVNFLLPEVDDDLNSLEDSSSVIEVESVISSKSSVPPISVPVIDLTLSDEDTGKMNEDEMEKELNPPEEHPVLRDTINEEVEEKGGSNVKMTQLKKTENNVVVRTRYRVILVKNLPVKVSLTEIHHLFAKFGDIELVRFRCSALADSTMPYVTAVIPQSLQKERLSVLAFIRYKNPKSAAEALSMNGTEFQGHQIWVSFLAEEKQKLDRGDVVRKLPFDIQDAEDPFHEAGSRLVQSISVESTHSYIHSENSDAHDVLILSTSSKSS